MKDRCVGLWGVSFVDPLLGRWGFIDGEWQLRFGGAQEKAKKPM
jgi:hypothetical protein